MLPPYNLNLKRSSTCRLETEIDIS